MLGHGGGEEKTSISLDFKVVGSYPGPTFGEIIAYVVLVGPLILG